MTKTLTTLVCALAFAALACGQKRDAEVRPSPTPTPQQAAAQPTPSATCRLLSAADIREAQGEEPTATQASEHLAGGVASSQCFYPLPTFEKSVGLEVVRAAAGAPGGALKDYWRKRFGPEALKERRRERERREEAERKREEELERERKSGQVREGGHAKEEEGEEEVVPRRVAGLGDEAFWAGGEKDASLYVLRKDVVVRVNVGAPGEPGEKIRKAAELARKVLKQL
ncbi:MAG TPA: hypothetical protein VNZ44_09685 [Pyrinomonadaceae bacterium]|nr:hypothetical protein [Pyrinomonadaceae bacterium]